MSATKSYSAKPHVRPREWVGIEWLRVPCPWTLLIAACAVFCETTALWDGIGLKQLLVLRIEPLLDGEIWRLLTGHLVHLGPGHLLRDLPVLLLVGWRYEGELGWRYKAALAVSAIAVSVAAVAAYPRLLGYCGLSGIDHAVLGAALVFEMRRRRPLPWWVIVTAVVAVAKVALETWTGRPALMLGGLQPADVFVEAHTVGFVCGLLVGALPRVSICEFNDDGVPRDTGAPPGR